MRAELHGKMDPESTLPSARLEDTLTDAVFSAVRYLPRRVVLERLLSGVLPGQRFTTAELDAAEILFWPAMPSVLWPGRRIEPDVVVVVGRHAVVFEAKYHSDFGRYDFNGQDLHQLAVQWRAASSWAFGRGVPTVTVVAVTTDALAPPSLPSARKQLLVTAPDLPPADRDRSIQWLPWHAMAALLRDADGLQPHEDAVRQDVLALMDRRGVGRVFQGFSAEDYTLVSSAQQAAAERLYPTISTFVQELTGLLDSDGVDWGWTMKGMWATNGLGWQRPQDWTRDFLAAPFWPGTWPQRLKNADTIALYVLFDFMSPGMEVGYVQSPSSNAMAQQKWQPHLPALAQQLRGLSAEHSIAVDSGDWTSPAASRPVHEADAQWLMSLNAYTHLRLRRRMDIGAVTSTGVARQAVVEMQQAVEACPALHAMLQDSGQLSATPTEGASRGTA